MVGNTGAKGSRPDSGHGPCPNMGSAQNQTAAWRTSSREGGVIKLINRNRLRPLMKHGQRLARDLLCVAGNFNRDCESRSGNVAARSPAVLALRGECPGNARAEVKLAAVGTVLLSGATVAAGLGVRSRPKHPRLRLPCPLFCNPSQRSRHFLTEHRRSHNRE